jgi:hypothetical protein
MELGCGRSHVESVQPTSPAIWTDLLALCRHGSSLRVKQCPDLDSRIKGTHSRRQLFTLVVRLSHGGHYCLQSLWVAQTWNHVEGGSCHAMLMAEVEKVFRKLKSWILEGQSGMLAEWIHASRDTVSYTEVLYSKMLQEMLEKVSPNSGDARALRGFSRLFLYLT